MTRKHSLVRSHDQSKCFYPRQHWIKRNKSTIVRPPKAWSVLDFMLFKGIDLSVWKGLVGGLSLGFPSVDYDLGPSQMYYVSLNTLCAPCTPSGGPPLTLVYALFLLPSWAIAFLDATVGPITENSRSESKLKFSRVYFAR